MNETDCYKKLYGNLVYFVPHYQVRLGYFHIAVVNKNGKKTEFLNGEQMDFGGSNFSMSAWLKINPKEEK